jgi:alkanesulfonate monooxygenase SsuD/methylene tetrahydromethanopterin reductase-like flavin-dependent oxidoreductase (luciferase family)
MRAVASVTDDIVRFERLGFDSVWAADHLFVERNGERRTGHDPLVLFAHAAARTSRIQLGTLVLGAPFRPVWQVAREAAALSDASQGRFVLGLGAGWHQPEFDAFDIPFDHLVSRLESQVTALQRHLFPGGRHSFEDRYVTLRNAEVLTTAPPPPVWIAGKGPRILRLTARLADGWNVAWGGDDPAWMTGTLDTVRRELDAAGRDPATFTTSAAVSIPPGTDERQIAETARAYERTGVDVLILGFWTAPGGDPYPEGPERTAGALGLAD